jgi:hypothetical protein
MYVYVCVCTWRACLHVCVCVCGGGGRWACVCVCARACMHVNTHVCMHVLCLYGWSTVEVPLTTVTCPVRVSSTHTMHSVIRRISVQALVPFNPTVSVLVLTSPLFTLTLCVQYLTRISSSWWWRHYTALKRRFTLRQHSIISQNDVIFILIAVRTWSLTLMALCIQTVSLHHNDLSSK